MQITIELPDDVAERLQAAWGNCGVSLEQKCLELLLVNAYQNLLLSHGRLQELLAFSTALELDAFLQAAGVELPYDEADFERDRQTLRAIDANQRLTA